MRIGIGYDIHRFNGRRPLKLGGVRIPFGRGLAGHSDADVLLHALADALLGALGGPDLGELFPSSSPKWRHADSRRFVEAAYARVRRDGWTVGNVDATVIADAPTLVGYKPKMRAAIGRLLHIEVGRVSVKAKTTEGFAPAKQGIAAQAVVLLEPSRPPSASGLGTSSPTPRNRGVPGLGRRRSRSKT